MASKNPLPENPSIPLHTKPSAQAQTPITLPLPPLTTTTTAALHDSLNEAKDTLTEVMDLVYESRDINDEVKALLAEVSRETRAAAQNTAALLRNQGLRNPALPIAPLVVYRSGGSVAAPDAALWPRDADEFYALRDPQTERQRSMVGYLVGFYGVDVPRWGEGMEDYELAVDLVENVLGLQEDRFIAYRATGTKTRPRLGAV
ncbi:hypothetical protein B0T22DRAFT_26405 [Podospora appendiculata]|uniref:Uncharacterized protein n=1 Tax=Podospora appendiculata TaxID=314037 RepID=A0AAE0XG84_9PEZI|nr:hypothetical protein B0T22DRAFT_26405 [Podospora appendiculata]